MRSAGGLAELEQRLVVAGCPADRVRDRVRELADHHADLKDAALAEGLSEPAAEVWADEQLGDPADLEQHLAAAFRQASWFGRHPILGFGVLPLLGFQVAWGLLSATLAGMGLGLLTLRYGRSFTPTDLMAAFAAEPDAFTEFYAAVSGLNYLALGLVVLVFCRLARRSLSGIRWAVVVCAVSAGQGLFLQTSMGSHQFSFGYGWPPNCWCAVLPLVLGAGILLAHWRRQRRVAVAGPSPAVLIQYPRRIWPKPGRLNPTTLLALGVTAGLVALALWARERNLREDARLDELRLKIWPAERATVLAQLQARQQPETLFETTINLQRQVNAALTDSITPSLDEGNNLAGLPTGVHTFAGVPFEVSGRVQLLGREPLAGNRPFPTHVSDIHIGRRCQRIYLLHGASFGAGRHLGTGATIGRLVLHYADDGEVELPIIAGGHLLDWWGPVFRTGARPERRFTTVPGSELAWVGTNPAIQQAQPENSLRLYKSMFLNPRPETRITSVDYCSMVTEAAPFLVGLTVE